MIPEIKKHKITEQQKDKILKYEENHFLDIKGVDIKPAKLTETISALANTCGGDVYIGIDEKNDDLFKPRIWRGFADIEAANAHLQTIERMSTLSNHYTAEFLECECSTGLVLHLTIYKSTDILLSSRSIPHIRRGAQNLPLTQSEQIEQLKRDKGIISFESEKIDTAISDITNSIIIIHFLLNVIPTAEPEDWLNKQKLILNNMPSVAGILLFSDEPQASLPKRSAIKIFRYETKEEGQRETLAFDPITIEGCLYEQIKEAVSITKQKIEKIQKMGDKGLENVTYPSETLHEIITNAVLHRDYRITTDIQIRIYDNRIEVESPGRLPGHITEKNILTEQFARNSIIVRIINKFPNPPNKDVGEGLNTAFEAMRKLRLKEPVIKERENSVIVYIKHEPLASPAQSVMEYLESHSEINNSTAREITGITSENKMKRVFLELQKKNQIERVPGKKGSASAWQKT